jgi:chemotaxis protein methyltransferase CheR
MGAPSFATVAEQQLDSLARTCGLPLPSYRASHVSRCLERAMVRTGTRSLAELGELFRRDPRSRAGFRRSVLVPVTGMFRDSDEFQLLETEVLPRILAGRQRIAVWSAGCATGDELHTVSSLLERAEAAARAELLGSDIRPEAIEAAAQRASELPAGLQIRYEARDLIGAPPPNGPFDLVLCRNVLIYLAPAAQDELRRRLISVLRPGGFLMLGRSEVLVRPGALGVERVTRHIFRRRR